MKQLALALTLPVFALSVLAANPIGLSAVGDSRVKGNIGLLPTNYFALSMVVRDFCQTRGIDGPQTNNLAVPGSSLAGNSPGDFWSDPSRYQPAFGAGTNEIRLIAYGINDIQGHLVVLGGEEAWFELETNAVYACHTNGIWAMALATCFFSFGDTTDMETIRNTLNTKKKNWIAGGADGMRVVLVDWDAAFGDTNSAPTHFEAPNNWLQDNTHESDYGAANGMWNIYNTALDSIINQWTGTSFGSAVSLGTGTTIKQ